MRAAQESVIYATKLQVILNKQYQTQVVEKFLSGRDVFVIHSIGSV